MIANIAKTNILKSTSMRMMLKIGTKNGCVSPLMRKNIAYKPFMNSYCYKSKVFIFKIRVL